MAWRLDASGTIFADTSGLFALAVRGDQHFRAAQELQRTFIVARTQLLTTNFVLAELHALMLSRVGIPEGNQLLDSIERSRTLIERASVVDEERARDIIRKYADHGYSLTDAISFAMMDRLGIRRAFTFDEHFARYGVTIPVEV